VKKIVASILLFSFLMSNTPLKELVKLPLLVQHFVKHKHENKKIGFIDFLKMHYFNEDPKDADYEEDMKLPFKAFSNDFSSIVFSNHTPTEFALQHQFFVRNNQPKFGHQTINFTSFHLNAIWQPPKFC
jgi:hypothetical protein